MHALILLSACLLGSVKAFPAYQGGYKQTGCSVSEDTIPLPKGQTNLTIPTDAKPLYITAGFGTQNYSCNAAGTYTSNGAVAELFDASCAFKAACDGKTTPSYEDAHASMHAAYGPDFLLLGHHYFVNNPVPGQTGVSPVFDFRGASQKGNPNAFVTSSKTGDIPSPHDPHTNVDWLELKGIEGQGDLAKYVFRILTEDGQPPASCSPGTPPITVPYFASYWFFK